MVTLAYSRATRVATHLQDFFGPVLGGTRKSEGGMGGGDIYKYFFIYRHPAIYGPSTCTMIFIE